MNLKKPKSFLSIFFNRKKEKSATEKIEEMLPHLIKYLPQIREMMNRGSEAGSPMNSDGEIIGRMYDFYRSYGEITGFNTNEFMAMGAVPSAVTVNTDGVVVSQNFNPPKDQRQAATPLSVMNELATVPVPFTLEGLDEKIETMKDKSAMINQRYAKE